MSKKQKWEPPPPLRPAPRDPNHGMLRDGNWHVFTMDGVPCLFHKQRVSWPGEHTGRKSFIGFDWIPYGPVETARAHDCLTLANIRAEVRDMQTGFCIH